MGRSFFGFGQLQALLIKCLEIICDSTYREVPVVETFNFELFLWVQSQNIPKHGPTVDFEISHILEASILVLC